MVAGELGGRRARIAIVGAVFVACSRPRRGDVDVTVIDRANHHLFAPLLLSDGDRNPR